MPAHPVRGSGRMMIAQQFTAGIEANLDEVRERTTERISRGIRNQRSALRTEISLFASPSSELLGYYHSSARRTARNIFCAKRTIPQLLTISLCKSILPAAYRTPPVRGQDRVHLIEMPSYGSHEPPFSPSRRTPGDTAKEVRHARSSLPSPS